MNEALGSHEEKNEGSIFQEKYKVISDPLFRINDPIDQLDMVLTVLDDDNWKPHTFHDIRHYVLSDKKQIPDKDLELAIEKLCDDKYLSVVENFDGRSPIEKSQNIPIPGRYYRITFSGRLFVSKVSVKFKGRPYRNQKANDVWSNLYTKVKVVANVASTVIIIAIGAWGVYVTDKSNKLESTVEVLNTKVERKDFKIDSLTKLTTDTLIHKIK